MSSDGTEWLSILTSVAPSMVYLDDYPAVSLLRRSWSSNDAKKRGSNRFVDD
jgi:hypothetical protein